MPVFSTLFMIVTLSSIGLPGLNGFVGEFLILLGSFNSLFLGSWVYTAIAATGVIFSAVYMLWMVQRVFFGKITHDENRSLLDLTKREIAIMIPIILFIVWIGVYPSTFLKSSAASTKQVVTQMQNAKSGNVTPAATIVK